MQTVPLARIPATKRPGNRGSFQARPSRRKARENTLAPRQKIALQADAQASR